MEPEQLNQEKPRPGCVRRLLTWMLMLLFSLAMTPIACSYIECPFMPYYRSHFPKKTAMMKHRAGQAEKQGKKFQLRYRPVPLENIDESLPRAVVACEDAHFYEHHGFDLQALRKAYSYNKKRGRVVRGGSTISQQLAKNLWLSPKRSMWRKVVEAVLTARLELTLDKKRIMELYLNTIEWGDGVFGAQSASRAYFGVDAAHLTPARSALLAAAIPSPRRSNPGNPSTYLKRRQRKILRWMGNTPTPEPEQTSTEQSPLPDKTNNPLQAQSPASEKGK